MTALDIDQLLRRAEQAFLAGQLDNARADLSTIRGKGADHPAVHHLTALVEKKRGDAAAARTAFVAALRLAPNDPQINSNYANLLDAFGESQEALTHYEKAISAAPAFLDARFNRAMLLQRLGQYNEALTDIDTLLTVRPGEARFHSARGALLREAGRLADAGKSFDAAIALDPKRLVALHGRARVALERGEDQAASHYRRALDASPSDPQLLLGFAQALELEGRASEAIACLATAVQGDPGWVEGQALLARVRWEAGDGRAFTRDLKAAATAQRGNVDLWSTLASTLAGADLFAEAADAASAGVRLAGADPKLQLMEALYSSEAGQIDRADRLFAALPGGLPMQPLNEARHALRTHRFDHAAQLLDAARKVEPWSVAAWALTSLAWRLTDDPSASWLNDRPELVRAMELDLKLEDLAAIADHLRSLHRTRAHPINQSLRGGTQTRGQLFERMEPEIQMLASAIARAVEVYWSDLPDADPNHPLLRHRASRPLVKGSWSVRLTGGGFHIAHFHPQGILSSAVYLFVPQPKSPMEGWLEIGAPPAEFDLPLEPLHRIEPVVGRLALFPSFMFHGTRPFAEGERLTAAFDVVAP